MHRSFRFSVLRALGVLGALALAAPASATVVQFDAALQDDGSWRYDYVVSAESVGVGQFAIVFARELYTNLRDWTAPAGWDALIQQPETGPALLDDGLVDFCSQGPLIACDGPRIAPETTLAGFSIVFDWLGSGAPGSQAFEIRDPDTFDLIAVGSTARAAAVPAPPSMSLLAAALFGVLALWRRRPASIRPPTVVHH